MIVETGVVVVSGVMVVTCAMVDTVSYVEETLNVEIAVVTEDKVADPRTVDMIVFDDGKFKDEVRVTIAGVDTNGAIESDSVCTPGLADNPGIEIDPSGDNAVMGGVVIGRSVTTVEARDASTCGA